MINKEDHLHFGFHHYVHDITCVNNRVIIIKNIKSLVAYFTRLFSFFARMWNFADSNFLFQSQASISHCFPIKPCIMLLFMALQVPRLSIHSHCGHNGSLSLSLIIVLNTAVNAVTWSKYTVRKITCASRRQYLMMK